MTRPWLRALLLLVVLAALTALGVVIVRRIGETDARGAGPGRGGPAPVEVRALERGRIESRRIFSGTLQAQAEFVVAPRVGGRVLSLSADLSDPVQRGQVLARLDNDEYRHAVSQADADLAVAQAKVTEARAGLEIANRELVRVKALFERGIANESELDAVDAERLGKQAAVDVAIAQVQRAEAMVATARTRLAYTEVTATWSDGDDERIVAERFVDVGDTVASNAPLFSIVELDPIKAVVYVTEADYARLMPGQEVDLTTDALGSATFPGKIARMAPVFDERSRQARVELLVENPRHRLKPGMFVRAEVMLDSADDATIAPVDALVTRNGETGLFLVGETGETVRWSRVAEGIREGDRVQLLGEGLSGRVVTLGQQLLDDGSPISILEPPSARTGSRTE